MDPESLLNEDVASPALLSADGQSTRPPSDVVRDGRVD